MAQSTPKPANKSKQAKKSFKHWFAVVLFGAIIVVFALMGVNPNRMGGDDAGSGVAATVNDNSISLSEFRHRVEDVEQNAKFRLDQFPEAQRKMFTQQIQRRALEELILGEIEYQAATKEGIKSADLEVRDLIVNLSFLSENGRFMKERYRAFLENMNLSTEDFERQVRKQIVGQKLQELFLGAAAPSAAELKINRELTNQKLNIRFVDFKKEDLQKSGAISEQDVAAFLKSNKADIDKYYADNKVEFTQPEKITARHILIRVDDKRPDAQALKLAQALKKEATPENFAKLAGEHSDDPGSKAKGGELGEFERGRMVPEFEKAAFAMSPGQISEPIKSAFGYHIIYVEKKTPAGNIPLETAQNTIARKLILRAKESEVVGKINAMLAKDDKKDIDAFVKKAGLKWSESGEFDLSQPVIPKLGDSKAILPRIVKNGQKTGLVPEVIKGDEHFTLVDVLSWKQAEDKSTEVEGLARMVAQRSSADPLEIWLKDAEAKASIQRNPRLLQQ